MPRPRKNGVEPKQPQADAVGYSDELATEICAHIADNKSIRTICKIPGMPGIHSILRWLASPDPKYDFLRIQYAQSREQQADSIYEDIIKLEGELHDKKIDPATARVLIDSHKWRAGKMRPKVYGEQIKIDTTINSFDKMSDAELETRLKALEEKANG